MKELTKIIRFSIKLSRGAVTGILCLYSPRDGAVSYVFVLIFSYKQFFQLYFYLFQLSELEQRVLEAEGRAEEAEDKVNIFNYSIFEL